MHDGRLTTTSVHVPLALLESQYGVIGASSIRFTLVTLIGVLYSGVCVYVWRWMSLYEIAFLHKRLQSFIHISSAMRNSVFHTRSVHTVLSFPRSVLLIL